MSYSLYSDENSKLPTSMLNHNHQLEELNLLTNLAETMIFLLADTDQAADQVQASPGVQNVKKLTLDASLLTKIGDSKNALEYQATPGEWAHRSPQEQKQMCEAAFKGFTKAVEVCVVGNRDGLRFLDRLPPSAAELDHGFAFDEHNSIKNNFTPADIINILSQFPAMQKLELPKMERSEVRCTAQQRAQLLDSEQLAADTSIQLSLHPKLLSLQIGQTKFIRETVGENLSRVFGPERNPHPGPN